MFEISKIIMPNVIHFLGVSGIPKGNSPGAQANVLKKCRTFGACAEINQLLNV